jgi:hypothetical protein
MRGLEIPKSSPSFVRVKKLLFELLHIRLASPCQERRFAEAEKDALAADLRGWQPFGVFAA